MLAEALRKARGHRTQAEFAQFLGIPSQQAYANYENGRIPRSRSTLVGIAKKLGVDPDVFLTKTQQHAPVVRESECVELYRISRSPAEFVRYLDEDDLQKYLARAIKAPGDFPEEIYGALAAENFRRAAVEKRTGQPYAYPQRINQPGKQTTP